MCSVFGCDNLSFLSLTQYLANKHQFETRFATPLYRFCYVLWSWIVRVYAFFIYIYLTLVQWSRSVVNFSPLQPLLLEVSCFFISSVFCIQFDAIWNTRIVSPYHGLSSHSLQNTYEPESISMVMASIAPNEQSEFVAVIYQQS